ncbi:MAG: hypothetical protein JXB47_03365 [Anaerolineae bacterium]|nr:hypothetical protein [Anaerolineae bacterium]
MAFSNRSRPRWALPLIAIIMLSVSSLGCNLTGRPAATPTVTLIGAPPPRPMVTQLLLPTATPGPSQTPLGGQFNPTLTLPPTPTQIPLPSVVPPTHSPTPTTTATSDIASTGPLEIESIELTDRREAGGKVEWTVVVHAVGGNGDYTYEHLGERQAGPIFKTAGTSGAAIVHEVVVRSGDGQTASCNYYIGADITGNFTYPCGD